MTQSLFKKNYKTRLIYALAMKIKWIRLKSYQKKLTVITDMAEWLRRQVSPIQVQQKTIQNLKMV